MFYVLAVVCLLAIGGGVVLSHHANTTLARQVDASFARIRIHSHVAELRRITGRMNATGNDVFAHHDPMAGRVSLALAEQIFEPVMRNARAALAAHPDADASLAVPLAQVERHVADMGGATRKVFDLFDADERPAAAAVMAEMNRKYSDALDAMEVFSAGLRQAEAAAGRKLLEDTRAFKRYETGLIMVYVLLIMGVVAYGRQIGTVLQRQVDDLSTFNKRLEENIQERTADLERAKRHVVELNTALAAHIEDLTQAQADLTASEQAVRAQSDRLQQALQHLPHGIAWFDTDDDLVVCNRSFSATWKLAGDVTAAGTPHTAIAHAARAAAVVDDDTFDVLEAGRQQAKHHGQYWQQVMATTAGGHMTVRHAPMPDGGTLSTYTDVTTLRRLEARVAHLAHHDALTELLNRHGLATAIQMAVAHLDRGGMFAILCLDLDHFKRVNDTHGHAVGDKLLKAMAERLRSCVRGTDLVARIGGDEFAIVQMSSNLPDGAAQLARRIIDTIGAPYLIEGHHLVIGTSIGISLAPNDGRDVDTLLQHADLALYRAKTEGRGAFRMYHPDMNVAVRERRAFELDLRAALASAQFLLHYQPLVDTASRAIVGFEALLRWQHPERGLVQPSAFIPVAEEIGLMGDIGAWVLRTACTEAARWPNRLKIAVNVSPLQFREDRLRFDVVAALAASGLSPDRLELEITETVLLDHGPGTLDKLQRLRDLGVRIALDDFGTGYSSLAHLRQFPFDKVKIDRTFVQGAGNEEASMAIVRAVVGLSGNLGMAITAEGVETDAQLALLRAEGCSEAQGYIFSRPVPADEVSKVLTRLAAA
jgi:diguanylate cyclase (GGDEF)-like protein